MLKLSDLALRPDLQLGPMLVSPSRRLVEGPGGHAHLEPLIMQVFLLLLDAGGRVVTRNELFDQCWGGVTVGDDSLNRAIAKVRRTGAQIAPTFLEIETIPRTGYRLTGEIIHHLPKGTAGEPLSPPISRRVLIGGAAAAAALSAGALWWVTRPRTDPRFDTLMQRGRDSLRLDEPAAAAKYFDQAVAVAPRNARALGLLAYAVASGGDSGPNAVPGRTALASERAARAALAIDPDEPNALLAITFMKGRTLDTYSREEEYRRILTIDPDNTLVMRSLGQLLHSVGRCQDSLAIVDQALKIDSLAPDHHVRKALRLWVLGRIPEADRVSDRAMELWPGHRLVRMGRLMIYAFTERTQAALAMVEQEEARPLFLSKSAASVWRHSLMALANPTPSTIASARQANLEGARNTPAVAAWAILTLSALGELDAAFDVANGFLLSRGSVIVPPQSDTPPRRLNHAGYRNNFGLFTPPTKAMRRDPRFSQLADGLGLTDYWRRRGVGPDAFLFNP